MLHTKDDIKQKGQANKCQFPVYRQTAKQNFLKIITLE